MSEITDATQAEKDQFAAAGHYLLIYWLLFIYLSLQAMDEMIELFSVLNELEKGALGLFFEMNYFVGVCLSVYITWFVCSYEPPAIDCARLGGKCEIQKVLSGKLGFGKSTI